MMENLTEERALHPFASIAVFLATVFLGFAIIGPLIGFIIAVPFYPGNFMTLVQDLAATKTTAEIRVPFLVMQACATGIGLIAIPMLAYRFVVKEKPKQLIGSTNVLVLVMTAIAVVLFMFPNSIIIEWNANLTFSGSFWEWARSKEDLAEKFTKFITTFGSPVEFVIGIFIVAVLPAIGEEFTFRGWLQPTLQKVTNPHVAIWVSALIFSAFHFQFFGFVPRMFLGAMFGYLMYWSNNLWVPIAAHFVNNAFSLLMVYLHQTGVVKFDAESTDALPLTLVVPATVIFVGLMFQLKKQTALRDQTA